MFKRLNKLELIYWKIVNEVSKLIYTVFGGKETIQESLALTTHKAGNCEQLCDLFRWHNGNSCCLAFKKKYET